MRKNTPQSQSANNLREQGWDSRTSVSEPKERTEQQMKGDAALKEAKSKTTAELMGRAPKAKSAPSTPRGTREKGVQNDSEVIQGGIVANARTAFERPQTAVPGPRQRPAQNNFTAVEEVSSVQPDEQVIVDPVQEASVLDDPTLSEDQRMNTSLETDISMPASNDMFVASPSASDDIPSQEETDRLLFGESESLVSEVSVEAPSLQSQVEISAPVEEEVVVSAPVQESELDLSSPAISISAAEVSVEAAPNQSSQVEVSSPVVEEEAVVSAPVQESELDLSSPAISISAAEVSVEAAPNQPSQVEVSSPVVQEEVVVSAPAISISAPEVSVEAAPAEVSIQPRESEVELSTPAQNIPPVQVSAPAVSVNRTQAALNTAAQGVQHELEEVEHDLEPNELDDAMEQDVDMDLPPVNQEATRDAFKKIKEQIGNKDATQEDRMKAIEGIQNGEGVKDNVSLQVFADVSRAMIKEGREGSEAMTQLSDEFEKFMGDEAEAPDAQQNPLEMIQAVSAVVMNKDLDKTLGAENDRNIINQSSGASLRQFLNQRSAGKEVAVGKGNTSPEFKATEMPENEESKKQSSTNWRPQEDKEYLKKGGIVAAKGAIAIGLAVGVPLIGWAMALAFLYATKDIGKDNDTDIDYDHLSEEAKGYAKKYEENGMAKEYLKKYQERKGQGIDDEQNLKQTIAGLAGPQNPIEQYSGPATNMGNTLQGVENEINTGLGKTKNQLKAMGHVLQGADNISGPAPSGPSISQPALSTSVVSAPTVSQPENSAPVVSAPSVSGPAISNVAPSQSNAAPMSEEELKQKMTNSLNKDFLKRAGQYDLQDVMPHTSNNPMYQMQMSQRTMEDYASYRGKNLSAEEQAKYSGMSPEEIARQEIVSHAMKIHSDKGPKASFVEAMGEVFQKLMDNPNQRLEQYASSEQSVSQEVPQEFPPLTAGNLEAHDKAALEKAANQFKKAANPLKTGFEKVTVMETISEQEELDGNPNDDLEDARSKEEKEKQAGKGKE